MAFVLASTPLVLRQRDTGQLRVRSAQEVYDSLETYQACGGTHDVWDGQDWTGLLGATAMLRRTVERRCYSSSVLVLDASACYYAFSTPLCVSSTLPRAAAPTPPFVSSSSSVGREDVRQELQGTTEFGKHPLTNESILSASSKIHRVFVTSFFRRHRNGFSWRSHTALQQFYLMYCSAYGGTPYTLRWTSACADADEQIRYSVVRFVYDGWLYRFDTQSGAIGLGVGRLRYVTPPALPGWRDLLREAILYTVEHPNGDDAAMTSSSGEPSVLTSSFSAVPRVPSSVTAAERRARRQRREQRWPELQTLATLE